MTSTDAQLAAMFRAAGHPVRLGILRRLSLEPETCACDFAEVFHVAQPTISQHLKVLREAGLVTSERRGTQICYSIAPVALDELRDVLGTLTGALAVAGTTGFATS